MVLKMKKKSRKNKSALSIATNPPSSKVINTRLGKASAKQPKKSKVKNIVVAKHPNAKAITEEDKIHEKWYADSRNVTLDTLPKFIENIVNNYSHSYGTICHAITAGALATAWAIDKSPNGGISGFQGSVIQWEFIRHWSMKEGPLKLVEYENMLYPQYSDNFEKTITKDTWKYLKTESKKRLKEYDDAMISNDPELAHHKFTHIDVVNHWKSIIAGTIPFGYTIKKN